jgi:hypothetical protein
MLSRTKRRDRYATDDMPAIRLGSELVPEARKEDVARSLPIAVSIADEADPIVVSLRVTV